MTEQQKPTDGACRVADQILPPALVGQIRHNAVLEWAAVIDREAVAPAVRELVDQLKSLIVYYTASMADAPEDNECWTYIIKAQQTARRYRPLPPLTGDGMMADARKAAD